MFRTLIFVALLLANAAIPLEPDRNITPGAVASTDRDEVCTPGYAKSMRHTSEATKLEVFAAYGIEPSGDYEIDHLISLELGGDDVAENLWPQSYLTQPWNARAKDRLENYLHREVCAGRLRLSVAQLAIATDWIKTYRHFLGDPPT